ncbi:MAG: hypothetical protein LBT23_11465 [Synergistaceae bacterium]|jgi:hypothetical protein|nr:hypothetical protein [Synergistaceae bacterium]
MDDIEKTRVIQSMKGISSGETGANFPIRLDDMSVIGYLRAIDRNILGDMELTGRMASARTRYKTCFLTQFDVTPENKRSWLEHSVLRNEKKMLFLVEAEDHIVVGQDGFTLQNNGIFSLDGTIRWHKYGHKELYVRCGIERAAICFFLLSCCLSTTEVFKDNIPNVKNSLKMGHEIVKEHKLFLSEKDGVFRYNKIGDDAKSNTDRTLLSFEMSRERFLCLHPGISESYRRA